MTENQKCGIGLENPKGIPQQSPGLRGTSYPGITRQIGDNPERVVAQSNGSATRPQPLLGWEISATLAQRSSFLATLGFIAESLWDSPTSCHTTDFYSHETKH
jgi:hypothetical protein